MFVHKSETLVYIIYESSDNMEVCDDCRSGEVLYVDMDDMEQYCDDCYDNLDKEYIRGHKIKTVGYWSKRWYR